MHFIGLGTAVPPTRYTQHDCWEALRDSKPFFQLSARSRAILRKVLSNENGIESRHLALEPLTEAFNLTPDALHVRFAHWAPKLASQAIAKALEHAGVNSGQVDAVIASTCTGYLCPGLTSYISEQIGLNPHCRTFDLVGQGCGAAIPNLQLASSLIEAGEAEIAVCVCVEVCSAAFYLDDDPGVLISACLFGDGAGAAVVSKHPQNGSPLRWIGSKTVTRPEKRDALRFETRGGMLRNLLTRAVPEIAGNEAKAIFESMARKHGILKESIGTWILHPGGREILESLGSRLGLNNDDLCHSVSVLRHYGNLSSASVFFILEKALSDEKNGSPGPWWMSSFGAGFTCHGAWLERSRPQ